MSENIGNLYVRAESEEEVAANLLNSSPKKSTSLSSLRSLRDTFKRSESRTSQTSLASATAKNDEVFDSASDSASAAAKAGKLTEKKKIEIYFRYTSIELKKIICENLRDSNDTE